METLKEIVQWITYQDNNSAPVYALLAALALGLYSYFFPYTHRYVKLFGSLIHEAGHATMALFLGLRVSKIKLDSHGNGVTEFYSHSRLRNFPVALAGYMGPPALAALLAWTISNHMLNAAIAILIFTFILLTIFVRSIVAIFINLLLGGVIYLAFTVAPSFSSIVMFIFIGMLLSSGIMGVISARKVRIIEGRDAGTDPQVLARMTLIIPAMVWEALFLLFSFGSLALTLIILVAPKVLL
jgi:hypothetical protein